MAERHGQDAHILVQMWRTSVWRLIPFLLIYSIGFATVFPVIPILVTNGFASEAAGRPMDCQQYPVDKSPPECDHAHTQVVNWSAWSSAVSGSVLSFLCAPAVGKMSDIWGRKPFIMAGVALSLAPMLMLMLHCWGLVSIRWYYPMSALNGMVSSFALATMMVADLLPQGYRASAVAYLSACFSAGIIIGPALGGFIQAQLAVYICIVMIVGALLYLLLFMPETAPRLRTRCQPLYTEEDEEALSDPLLKSGTPSRTGSMTQNSEGDGLATGAADVARVAARAAAEPLEFDVVPNVVPGTHEHEQLLVTVAVCDRSEFETQKAADDSCNNARGRSCHEPAGTESQTAGHAGSEGCQSKACRKDKAARGNDMLVGWRVIRASAWYRKLVVVWIIVSMTFEGAQDLLFQYLLLKLAFQASDIARILIVIAICGLAIKLLAMNTMVRVLGEQWLLVLGLGAFMLQNLLLALANSKLFAMVAIAVGSMACVCWPASVALQTKHVEPEHIGAVQGALHGISSLASGIGPLMFAGLFTVFNEGKHGMPHYPQVVWYVAAVMALLGALVTATLHWTERADPNIKRSTSNAATGMSAAQAAAAATRSTSATSATAQGTTKFRGPSTAAESV